MKNSKRTRQLRKTTSTKPSHQSKYGKKRDFLHRNGGRGIDYPDKPWK